jgi:DNA-binding transcriptional LysR family regulator
MLDEGEIDLFIARREGHHDAPDLWSCRVIPDDVSECAVRKDPPEQA